MESLRKALKRTSKHSTNHEKIKDKWGDEREPVRVGVKFYLSYLGSTLVDELDEGLSYGNKISAKAVKIITDMAKSVKKHPKVEISISSKGIVVTNLECKVVLTSLSIYRIHFCTADKNHDRVFAYIARSTENENMECHAFLCPKKKVAEAVTLTVAQAFQIAKEDYEEQTDELERQKHQEAFRDGSYETSSSSASSTQPQNQSQGFEDSFTDSSIITGNSTEDCTASNPFRNSTFNTDLDTEIIDSTLLDWLEQQDNERTQRDHAATQDLIQF